MRVFSSQTPVLLICRAALAFSWIYQGAVPKIACQSSGETELLGHIIPLYQWVCEAVFWIGVAEILFGLLLLVAFRAWVFWLNIVALNGLLLFSSPLEPGYVCPPQPRLWPDFFQIKTYLLPSRRMVDAVIRTLRLSGR